MRLSGTRKVQNATKTRVFKLLVAAGPNFCIIPGKTLWTERALCYQTGVYVPSYDHVPKLG